ncbi:MAG: hypothetical protein ACSNEK_05485 [Parachlamydiaceae bacterium]
MSKTTVGMLVALIFVITAIVLFYVGNAFYKVYQYNRLKETTSVTEISWRVKPESDEHYYLEASYSYLVEGKAYQGETVLAGSPYRNAWAANQALKEISPQYHYVWYDPDTPSFSNLEKNFPSKAVIYAAIMFVILNYFAWGGYFYTTHWLKAHGLDRNDRIKK